MKTIRVDDDILLRWPSMADAEELVALIDSNRRYLGRWLPLFDAIRTMEDERVWIEGRQAAEEKGEGTPPLIVYRGAIVGTAGAVLVDSPNRSCEVGYWLTEEMQGRGIVTRACRAVLDYAFGELQLNRVQIRAATQNKKSRAIPERMGFVFEGVQRQAELVNGEYYDLALYSMLASEWSPS